MPDGAPFMFFFYDLEFNPNQLLSASIAGPLGHVPHPTVEGQPQ